LPQHSLSFTTKLQVHNVSDVQVVWQTNKVKNSKSTWNECVCRYLDVRRRTGLSDFAR
jgi:hypothetical protein